MPWVQAVPLSDLPVRKVIQKCEGLAFLRGESALGTHRAKRCKVSLWTHMSSSATDQDYLPPCAAAWAAVSGFAALRMPHPPCGEKSATLFRVPRGAGLGGQDWWIFAPNESVLFDNFNASRLRARNVGGALSILRIAK